MTTTLSEGVKVPDVGSVNWAGDLEVNWNLLNGALANLSGNVKLDRDNTWTGEQSFTLPIVGSITGTAAKAIADEDGTSIKTGYVNVAGNQTVTGQKTWSALNSYNQSIQITTSFDIGAAPSSEVSGGFNFGNGTSNIGNVTARVNSGGATYSRLYIGNKFTNGALDPNGTWKYAELQVGLRANGDRFIYTDGLWRNNLTPYNNTYSLGSSSYQWSSVYAQSYYYNGTQWGLDQSNNWTGSNRFTGSVILPAFGSNNYKNYGIVTDYGYTQSNNYYRFLRTTGIYNSDNTPDTSKPSFLTFRPMRLQTELMDNIQVCNDGTYNYLAPITTGVTDLGTSTNKWKSLNGVNPGALSLPSSSYVDISGDITIRDGSASNSLTALCDGWIAICTFATWLQMSNDTLVMAVTGAIGTDGFSQAFLPVRKGDSIRIILNQTNTLFQSFKLIPCLGNV